MGAPIGNKNAAKAKVWHGAIQRALDRRTAQRTDGRLEIDVLADKLLDAVSTGDLPALKEFGDRLDGKPAQVIVGDADADPIQVEGRIRLIRPEGEGE